MSDLESEAGFQVGDTFYLFKSAMKKYKCHVRAIIDGDRVVYRWYGRHRPGWHYEVARAALLHFEIEQTQRF